MCSRYFVNQELADILAGMEPACKDQMRTGDFCPSQSAFVWIREDKKTALRQMVWGFPQKAGRELLINARAESALEKPFFRDATLTRRCVIPVSGFYEWDRTKNKVTFMAQERSFLYMAGIYGRYEEALHFVALTTKADQTVLPVHHRMPLLFDRNEAMKWLSAGEERGIRTLLSMKSLPVEIADGYIQEKFSFL